MVKVVARICLARKSRSDHEQERILMYPEYMRMKTKPKSIPCKLHCGFSSTRCALAKLVRKCTQVVVPALSLCLRYTRNARKHHHTLTRITQYIRVRAISLCVSICAYVWHVACIAYARLLA